MLIRVVKFITFINRFIYVFKRVSNLFSFPFYNSISFLYSVFFLSLLSLGLGLLILLSFYFSFVVYVLCVVLFSKQTCTPFVVFNLIVAFLGVMKTLIRISPFLLLLPKANKISLYCERLVTNGYSTNVCLRSFFICFVSPFKCKPLSLSKKKTKQKRDNLNLKNYLKLSLSTQHPLLLHYVVMYSQ